MGAYILRRILLVIPTLLGIMIINFTLTQFVPGGPIQQIAARLDQEALPNRILADRWVDIVYSGTARPSLVHGCLRRDTKDEFEGTSSPLP